MRIAESARGKGYGNLIIQKVIEKRGLGHTYFCYIREDNFASIKSFEKNGFHITGMSYKQKFAIDNIEYKMCEYTKEPKKIIAIIPARSGSNAELEGNAIVANTAAKEAKELSEESAGQITDLQMAIVELYEGMEVQQPSEQEETPVD